MLSTALSATLLAYVAPTTPGPSPSAPPSPGPAPGACVPGHDGIPTGPLGHLMCGDYLAHAPVVVWQFARERWPLLLALAAVFVAARLGWCCGVGAPGDRPPRRRCG